ncbi:MAG: 3'-5' exonuclease [Gammaproteobacteria bacterium]|nr:MAG: 3'-5' exonuclease [Gammaproteobacteria bacterium]
MNNIFVFDIETIPDLDAGRRLYDLDGLSDADTAKAMFHIRHQESGGSEFMRHHLHRIVAISAVFRHADQVKVWSLGEPDSSEKELLERFFDGLERYTPTLVSWNGGGFDLPVIHYRALLNGVSAPRYWETGNDDQSFRWNNYISRYHWRHTDLMDVLSGFQPRAVAPLDQIATMLGFPGKMGMDGSKVFDAWLAGEIEAIRDYCETDVLNTWLVYLRFEQMRGNLNASDFSQECEKLKETLIQSGKAHLQEFLARWQENQ